MFSALVRSRYVAAVGLAALGATVALAADIRTVRIDDQCDPETFNDAVGPGTCTSSHPGVTFDHFLKELTLTQRAGGWDFAPREVRMQEGEAFKATNAGGETHTFTEVDDFGGGIVSFLNTLSGNPVPAPECLTLSDADFIPPGATTKADKETRGTHHYQCCIHPWMRTDVVVR